MNTPHNPGGGSRLPDHFLTSTPYHRPGEGGYDTPPQDRSEDGGTPTNEDFRSQRDSEFATWKETDHSVRLLTCCFRPK